MAGPLPSATATEAWCFRRVAVRALLPAAVGVALLFAGYEILEHLWLRERYPDSLFLFHRMRGITAAVLATGLVGWAVLRHCPPFLESTVDQESDGERQTRSVEGRQRHYARWFIGMRWIAVLVAAALVAVGIGPGGFLPDDVHIPLAATTGVLALVNVVYMWWLSRGRRVRALLLSQLYGDVAIIAGFLHLSGGVESPLAPLLLFHVFIGGMVLPTRHAYLVAGAGTALFAAIALGEWSHLIPHHDWEFFPHAEAGGQTSHGAHDPSYASSVVAFQGALLLLAAHFTARLAWRLRWDEQEMARLAEEARARSQLLEEALDTTGTALCVSDSDGAPTWMNGRWAGWFGRSGDPSMKATEADHDPLANGWKQEPEHATRVETHGDRVFRISRASLLDAHGGLAHRASLAQDITDEKRAEEGMLRAERLAAVGELAGRMAHEVNNPMGIISAKGRLMLSRRRDELSNGAAEELEKIVRLSDRVARISQGVLSYARPARRSEGTVDLRRLLREALEVVEGPARSAGVELHETLPQHGLFVRGNADELEQVFMNLLVNALDAMPKGGTLRVSSNGSGNGDASSGAEIAIRVEDTGEGIPGENHGQIFEPFWTTKPDGKGTGLGLSICLGLVRSHGGTIGLDSAPGEGTGVTVTLPAAPTANEGRQSTAEEP